MCRSDVECVFDCPDCVFDSLFRYDVKFGTVIGEGHFGKVWHAKAKGIKVSTV